MCDGLTPVSAFQRIDTGESACLFESVIGGEKVGRYSFLAIEPSEELAAYGTQLKTFRKVDSMETESAVEDPLDELRERFQDIRVAPIEGLAEQPLIGGAIGYAGYDVVRYVEHLPNAPDDDRQLPDMSFAFYDQLIVFDNVTKTMVVVAVARIPKEGADARSLYDDACRRVDDLIDKLTRQTGELPLCDIHVGAETGQEYRSNTTQTQFESAVQKCVEYIRAGDIFQVVLSQRLEVDYSGDPFEIYRTLRIVNPSPFMFFLRTRETTLIGSSPRNHVSRDG